MKRGFVYLFALSALMAMPSVAAAAKWNGVVVAKDGARQAFVTTSRGGTMRTVRAPARFASLRIGAKVAVRGLRLSDGTFRSQGVRKLGRSKLALLDAVVVRQNGNRGRTILSGGGTVFSMRGGEHHEPGDELECLVKVKTHHLRAVDCEDKGHADAMKLEGIFLDASEGVLRIAVLEARPGECQCSGRGRSAGLRVRRPGRAARLGRRGRFVHAREQPWRRGQGRR